ncbi:MAG: hypothetical protein E5Y61_00065 [Mesorhizobium sp.]|uniref:SemiSWEET family sugar transporter n=1 Tax=Mesorhizobium TaxID=68287 RepID=UPI000FE776C1|nr:SemiSWEET transporter [Mesorhizobium sp.]RWI85459.1 MAG: hypothetical protein EOR22_30795 [Mesorhizobium sp.]RWO39103.1 MAG: hypothetical protein EOS13_33990 [Mesorhizobium sp.]TIM37238.1 MAG: hypothetical protein E5Y61_00065 [Mesorhizobium sp.]TIN22972.1 MAG: hypothetical protein E5Y19_29760 [Mesorhizobium sp.]TIO47302.1 MAG: hypothetical protein E5X78_33050 [Mesorhizobium sp.]
MDWITVTGYLAALCSVTAFTPQAWKIIKTRDTSSISALMYGINVLGFALWLTYGILRNDWALIITNVLILALSAFILLMTILPRAKKDAVANALDPAPSSTQRSVGPTALVDPKVKRSK